MLIVIFRIRLWDPACANAVHVGVYARVVGGPEYLGSGCTGHDGFHAAK